MICNSFITNFVSGIDALACLSWSALVAEMLSCLQLVWY